MASQTSKKPTASKRKPAAKSKAKAKNPKHKNHPSKNTSLSMVQYEIIVMLILAIALFIMISVYLGGGGVVGEFVRSLLFGTFGIGAWILPVGIFIGTFLKVFNKDNERLNIKLLLCFLMIVFISVFAHIIYVEYPQLHITLQDDWAVFGTLANYFSVSADFHVGGGFIGSLIGDVLFKLLGRMFSIVVVSVIFISLIIAITERSFLLFIKEIYTGLVKLMIRFIDYIGNKANDLKESKEVKAKEVAKQERLISVSRPVEEDPKPKKKHLVANLFKSTIHKDEEEYDIVKHIEAKEEQEQRRKEAMFNGLFDEAEGKDSPKTNKDIVLERAMSSYADEHEAQVDPIAFPEGADFEPVIKAAKESKSVAKVKAQEIENGKKKIEQEIIKELEVVEETYITPPIELLKDNPMAGKHGDGNNLKENATKLEETLASFGVGATVVDVAMGPTVTRYELQPDPGVKVSKIVNLADDIALNLAANGIRIEAPIPGKSAVGIEVPNKDVSSVFLREVLDTKEFEHFPSNVAFGLGKDISGKVIVTDIGRMPHLLIAGATGSGKSVCVNTLITSILYKSSPEDVKLLMIDPKVVELSIYNGIPHLLIPVVTDPKKAASALNWAVQEMLERYKLFAAANVRDIKGYNKAIKTNEDGLKKLPQIVIIVDELADLMVVAANEVEEAICRLAQMARAAGLHLIIATQRPSVDVITGLIKANIPSRIAFNVSSGIDSRTIIDMNGAEKLLGKGDMLFYPVGLQKPVRIQGAFVSDKEIENIVTFLKDRKKEEYDEKIMKQLDKSVADKNLPSNDYDPIFEDALELCVDKQKASASMIQRRFRVGYNRAARILDQLYDAGYVGDEEGSKPRKMLLTKPEFEALKARANGEDDDFEEADVVANDEAMTTQSTEE